MSMFDLTGTVAIVTGASKGIGASIAKHLAAEGAAVVVNYASSKTGAEKVVGEITAQGGKAVAVQANVAKKAEIDRLFAETKKTFGKADILVNNAGVYDFAPLEQISETQFHKMFDVNVLGLLLTTQEALKYFGSEGGSVINISSVVGVNPLPGAAVYSATKAAVDAVTKSLARELGPKKIRVNAISPGMVETEGVHAAGFIGTDLHKNAVAQTPLGRIGQPQDIATVATFLASPDSAWITGESFVVAGGYR
jgi:3-oxoacyl-[acyl-carrier protein] reductase